jgi:glycine/D-amino acid oxidase-like deaminating enzyme
VLIAGGGSGHGFKHGPVIGEYIARRAIGEATDPAFDHMVRLARG